jgi:hypothetical protein
MWIPFHGLTPVVHCNYHNGLKSIAEYSTPAGYIFEKQLNDPLALSICKSDKKYKCGSKKGDSPGLLLYMRGALRSGGEALGE